jgi:hypothetical protein
VKVSVSFGQLFSGRIVRRSFPFVKRQGRDTRPGLQIFRRQIDPLVALKIPTKAAKMQEDKV